MPSFILTGPVPGSAQAATGLSPVTIESGVNVQVATNLQAQAASAITPQTPVFAIQAAPGGGDRTITIAQQGIGGIPTNVVVNLLASYDGGTTWQVYASGSGLQLVNAGVPSAQQARGSVAGPLFSLAISALTLAPATGVNLYVTVS